MADPLESEEQEGSAGASAPAASEPQAPKAAAPAIVEARPSAPPSAGAKGYRATRAFSARLGWHGTYHFDAGHEFDPIQGQELYEKGAPLEPIR